MSSYTERQKSLFNHLKDAEEQCNFSTTNKAEPPRDYGTIDKQSYRRLKREMKQFRGKESIFKRQEANIRECLRAKRTPDHVKNPQKWTYYSLADVTPEQLSDATNTATALALMRDLEEKEAANEMIIEHDTDETGAVFKKPTFRLSKTIKSNNAPPDSTLVLKSNKIIMPEYVVGVSQKKEKKKSLSAKDSSDIKKAELKLNHLYEDDEDSES